MPRFASALPSQLSYPAPYRDTTVVTTEIWLTDESNPNLNQSILVGGPNGHINTSYNDSLTMYTPHSGNPEPVAMPKNWRCCATAVVAAAAMATQATACFQVMCMRKTPVRG
jgi:hypothetical protein